jgi:hypothetical protein
MAELAAAAQRNTRQYPVMFELGHGPPGDVTCVSQLSRAEECTHNRMETVSAKQNITFNRGAVRQQNIHLLSYCSKPMQRGARRMSAAAVRSRNVESNSARVQYYSDVSELTPKLL